MKKESLCKKSFQVLSSVRNAKFDRFVFIVLRGNSNIFFSITHSNKSIEYWIQIN